MTEDAIPFDRSMSVRPGEIAQLSPLVRRLIANNGGPFTFTGTCTYLVGRDELVVIDPGPSDASHHQALLAAIGQRRVSAILVTHSHRDHSPGAAALRVATGAPVLGPLPITATPGGVPLERSVLDAAHDKGYTPDTVLHDGDSIGGEGLSLIAVETPGHAAHHLCYALLIENALFSGDHVMGWSTTVIAPPDGSMGPYLASLEKLLGRAETIFYPGHGGPVANPQRFLRALLHHRRQRASAILARLRAGDADAPAIVAEIYDGLSPGLRGAAALSVLAHLELLVQQGKVERVSSGSAGRFRLLSPDQGV